MLNEKKEEKEELKHILVDSETRRKLKVRAALRDKTIGEIVRNLLLKEEQTIPNSKAGGERQNE